MTFGVVGYGAFGKFLTEILVRHGSVGVYSERDVSGELPVGSSTQSMSEVAKNNVVVISTDLARLEKSCKNLADHVSPSTLVADVCSVKTEPIEIMKKYLSGKCQIIGTHPLFGPKTVETTNLSGEKIVVSPVDIKNYDVFLHILRSKLGLEVIEMSPEEHDKEMATVQALSFFVGRGLVNMGLAKSKFSTGYYQKLLELVELENSHSVELFMTVEKGNPFAEEVRQKFIKELQALDKEIQK